MGSQPNILCDPSYMDTRQLVLEYAILQLGGEQVMKMLYKGASRHSMLLFGPPGVGKTSLVQAVAHETASYYFDLSPANILRKYHGKAAAMVDNVFEVAKGRPLTEEEIAAGAVQQKQPPAVIYIDEIEKVFEKPTMAKRRTRKRRRRRARRRGRKEGRRMMTSLRSLSSCSRFRIVLCGIHHSGRGEMRRTTLSRNTTLRLSSPR